MPRAEESAKGWWATAKDSPSVTHIAAVYNVDGAVKLRRKLGSLTVRDGCLVAVGEGAGVRRVVVPHELYCVVIVHAALHAYQHCTSERDRAPRGVAHVTNVIRVLNDVGIWAGGKHCGSIRAEDVKKVVAALRASASSSAAPETLPIAGLLRSLPLLHSYVRDISAPAGALPRGTMAAQRRMARPTCGRWKAGRGQRRTRRRRHQRQHRVIRLLTRRRRRRATRTRPARTHHLRRRQQGH